METKMSDIGRTAIRIGKILTVPRSGVVLTATDTGEQLESIHLERQRAQAAYDLISAFNNFSQDDISLLEALTKSKDGRRQVATLLRRLNSVAKEVDLPVADKASPLFLIAIHHVDRNHKK